MSTSDVSDYLAKLRAELKKWEHSFKKEHGRLPTKEDIKSLPEICKYFYTRQKNS